MKAIGGQVKNFSLCKWQLYGNDIVKKCVENKCDTNKRAKGRVVSYRE